MLPIFSCARQFCFSNYFFMIDSLTQKQKQKLQILPAVVATTAQ